MIQEQQALVLAGGYLTNPGAYRALAMRLRQPPFGYHVEVVQFNLVNWLAVRDHDFRPVADAIAQAVERARRASNDAPVTIVGHSAGGFVSRIYLGDELYNGARYAGNRYVNRLITLGSPHLSQEYFTRRGINWVNSHYPGAFCPNVSYITVAGKAAEGNPQGTLRQRLLFMQYRSQSGDGAEWGDGVVPIAVAHLEGAIRLTLRGVQHVPGRPGGYDDARALTVWGAYLNAERRMLNAEP